MEAVERFLKLFSVPGLFDNQALRVGFYRALPSELDLSSLESEFRKRRGCLLHYPRVVTREAGKVLEFVQVSDLKPNPDLWKTGSFGIQEPHPNLTCVLPGC